MSLHNRIREARRNKGLTQEELGRQIGVAKTTVAGYEKNREPTAAQLGEIADVLDVDVTFLLQDEIRTRHEVTSTPWEMENIIKKYRLLDTHGKEMVDFVLDKETERIEAEATARKAREAMEAGMIAPPTPTPPIASQPYSELDLTAQVAKLERQNQELAAEIAAMREQERKAPQEMTDEELRMELDRQLLEEKNRAENGVASGPTNSDTATG